MNNLAITDAIRDAEASVLGGCLLRPAVLRDLELEVEDFADHRHKVVFMAMRNLEANSGAIDVVTLENEIQQLGKLDAVGGIAFLGELALRVPTTDNVHAYAKLVRDWHLRRRVYLAAGAIVRLAEDMTINGEELLAELTQRASEIDGLKPDAVSSIGDLARRRFADIERFAREQAAGKRPLSGAPTGVTSLDAKTGGWQFGIVNLIAARPGMGKSALAMATADASSAAGFGAHVFTLEDSWHAYTDRGFARSSGVSQTKIRRAELEREDIAAVTHALVRMVQRTNWLVDDRGSLSAIEIVRAVRRAATKNGTRVVVVDYLNLVRRSPRISENEALGQLMQTFAEAAKADDMAYVVLAQLNRDLEKRVDKRPTLPDLRGSGEIEEKCKLAVGLYRGAYYGGKPRRDVDYECDCPEAAKVCAHTPSLEDWETQVQLLIMKGGNGPTGRVWGTWDGPTTRIS